METNSHADVFDQRHMQTITNREIDRRNIPNFYHYVPWFGFVTIFFGDDSMANRLICAELVSGPSISNHPIYGRLQQANEEYFMSIQEKLVGPLNYYWRQKVLADSR